MYLNRCPPLQMLFQRDFLIFFQQVHKPAPKLNLLLAHNPINSLESASCLADHVSTLQLDIDCCISPAPLEDEKVCKALGKVSPHCIGATARTKDNDGNTHKVPCVSVVEDTPFGSIMVLFFSSLKNPSMPLLEHKLKDTKSKPVFLFIPYCAFDHLDATVYPILRKSGVAVRHLFLFSAPSPLSGTWRNIPFTAVRTTPSPLPDITSDVKDVEYTQIIVQEDSILVKPSVIAVAPIEPVVTDGFEDITFKFVCWGYGILFLCLILYYIYY